MKFKFWCKSENRYVSDPVIHGDGSISCMDGIAGTDYCTNDIIVLEWTGCQDRTKTDIYEGDKIFYRGRTGVVEFVGGMFVVSWDDQTDDELAYMITDEMTVVGNIIKWEPKELKTI